MKVLIISTCKEKLHEREFVEPFVNYFYDNDILSEVVHYKDFTADNLMDVDKVLICGTGLMDNDYLDDYHKFDWLKVDDMPVLGVCSGSQIIVSVFGGKTITMKDIGMTEVSGNLFGKEKFSVYNVHQNALADMDEFEILLVSDTEAQAVKHKEKPIYGVAFHPEVRNMWVIDEFLKL